MGGAGEPTAARSYKPSWHEWGAESGPSMDSRCGKGWHILCPVCEIPFVRVQRREPAWRAGVRGDEEGRRGEVAGSCQLHLDEFSFKMMPKK